MKALFDTDVVLDLLLDREPFVAPAAELITKVEAGKLSGFLCATTVATIHYLASEIVGHEAAQRELQKLLLLFEVAPVNRLVLEAALVASFDDFENAVLHEAALHVGVDALVTRKVDEFANAELPVYSPDKLAHIIKQRGRSHPEKWASRAKP